MAKNSKSSTSPCPATAQVGQAPTQGGKRRNRKSRGSKPAPNKFVVGMTPAATTTAAEGESVAQAAPAKKSAPAPAGQPQNDMWSFDWVAAALEAETTSEPFVYFELPSAKPGHYNEIPKVYRVGGWEDDAQSNVLAVEMPESHIREWPKLDRYRIAYEYQERRLSAPVDDEYD